MTAENVKEFLGNYLENQKQLRILEELKWELLEIWEEPDDISMWNLENKKLWDQIDKLQNEMMQENINQIAACRSAMQETVSLIDTVEDEKLRELLYYKHICGMTFEQIAEKTYCCIETVMRRHKKVIEQLAGTMQNGTKMELKKYADSL